jgi:hypothetical protein
VPISISTVCPHCGEKVLFTTSEAVNDQIRLTVAATASCPGCNSRTHFFIIRHENEPKLTENNPAAIYMYPPARNYYPNPKSSLVIPEPLKRSFVSTIDAFNSRNYAATAVCGRRTLEGIFKYLVPAEKRNMPLASLIEAAKTEIDLAAPLTALSHAIRDGGNLGAHFDEEKEPDETLARQMVELLEYLISYLYVLPTEIKKLEQSLGKEAS